MAKEYLCMKKWKDLTYAVTYQLGAYYVSIVATKNNGLMLVPFDRKYKTASGASKYLEKLNRNDLKDYGEPEKIYGTEDFIKKGTFWKGE